MSIVLQKKQNCFRIDPWPLTRPRKRGHNEASLKIARVWRRLQCSGAKMLEIPSTHCAASRSRFYETVFAEI
jgi:hypothetical protein